MEQQQNPSSPRTRSRTISSARTSSRTISRAANLNSKDRNQRNAKGQLQKGHNCLPGAGRPRGSRSKLGEYFLVDLSADWEQHGASVIEKVRTENPAVYLRVVASILPAQLELNASIHADVESFKEAFEIAIQAIGATAPPKLAKNKLLELEANFDGEQTRSGFQR